jgi:aspartyl-tRNA(Asn)/glutamyl-tRNA(Gln) amidotransferase subunit C
MKIDNEALQKIAHLARLELNSATQDKMLASLEGVLTWMEQLNEIDTTGVEPLIHISEEMNVMRKDEALQTISHDQGLTNAPKRDANFFRVPKVIE